jgi:hypothetical protein
MSDSHTPSYNPALGTESHGRRPSVLLWLLVLLLAAGALAGAVWYAGGTDLLSRLGGMTSSIFGGSPGGSGGQKPAVPAPSASASATPTSSLPPEAQQRMFTEQAESREPLTALVEGRITSLKTGVTQRDESSATIPVTAYFDDGSQLSSFLHLKRFGDSWYFFSLSGTDEDESKQKFDSKAFDSGVVSTITQQQALPGTQEVLTAGVLDGEPRPRRLTADRQTKSALSLSPDGQSIVFEIVDAFSAIEDWRNAYALIGNSGDGRLRRSYRSIIPRARDDRVRRVRMVHRPPGAGGCCTGAPGLCPETFDPRLRRGT